MTTAQNYLAKMLGYHSDGRSIHGVSCPPGSSPSVHLSKILGVHSDGSKLHGYGASELGSGKVLISKFAGLASDNKQIHLVNGCEEECSFVCPDHCSGDAAPCVWKVVLDGIVNDGCADCANWNGTYLVNSAALVQGGSDPCIWDLMTENMPDCGDSAELQVQVITQGGNTRLGVTARYANGSFLFWVKIFSGIVSCVDIQDENIPWISDSGNVCDASMSTCTVSAA